MSPKQYYAAGVVITAGSLAVAAFCFLKGVQHGRSWRPDLKAV